MCIICCIVGIMRVSSVLMIHTEPPMIRADQDSERQRKHVVGIVRRRGQVQEEHKMHADLGDGQHGKRDRDGRRPDQMGVDRVEGRDREQVASTSPSR